MTSEGKIVSTPPGALRLNERFTVYRRLGEGASGVVYEAEDAERHNHVALKKLIEIDPEAIYRFKNEFRSLADVSHPNLVGLHELFSVDGQWYFTMDLVQGQNFLAYVRRDAAESANPATAMGGAALPKTGLRSGVRATAIQKSFTRTLRRTLDFDDAKMHGEADGGQVDLARLRDALRQLVEGVLALHGTGRLHRDLKPSNVLVTWAGRVVLLDFGLVFNTSRRRSALDADGDLLGTPAYMAPEQATGEAVTPAADWYAVGTMLFQALTGALPFVGTTATMLEQKISREAPHPSERTRDLPEDLAALCVRLLQRDAGKRPAGIEVARLVGASVHEGGGATILAPQHDTELVGRERHLAALAGAFAKVRSGQSVTAHVHGTSGMGKSALVNAFLDTIAFHDDALILEGRCYERESVPYKALDSLVDALADYVCSFTEEDAAELLPPNTFALARLFPVLRRSEFIETAVAEAASHFFDVVELRRRAFGALRALLTALARRHPLVVYLDDLQWGDKDSAALLVDLLEPPDPPPLLLLASYRTQDAETSEMVRVLRQRQRQSADDPSGAEVDEVIVGPLDPEESRTLARSVLKQPTDPGDIDAIAVESGGSPFFVRELVEAARGGVKLEAGKLSLQDVLLSRIGRLPDEARLLLEALAVAGCPLPANVAKRAAGVAKMEALSILRSAHFIRTRGTRETDEAETFHDRIRETVTASLAPEARRAWHGRLGLALEENGDADAEALTLHFYAAGDTAKARKYAERAAERAANALAFDRAASLFGTALELAEPGEVHALRVKLADALVNAGRGAEAARVYLTALDGAGNKDESLDLKKRAAMHFLMSGRIDEGVKVSAEVVRAVGMLWPRTTLEALVIFLYFRARIILRGLRYRVRDPSELSPSRVFQMECCRSISTGLIVVDILRSATFQSQAILELVRLGEPYLLNVALVGEAMMYARRGRLRAAYALAPKAREVAEISRNPHAVAMSLMLDGWIAYCDSKYKVCLENCERSLVWLKEKCPGTAWEISTMNLLLLLCLIRMGEYREVVRRVPVFVKDAQQRGDEFGMITARTAPMTGAMLALDEPEKAIFEAQDAMKNWPHHERHLQHALALASETHALLYMGKPDVALSLMDEAWPALRRSFVLLDNAMLSALLSMRARCFLRVSETAKDRRPLFRAARRTSRKLLGVAAHWGKPAGMLVDAAIAHGNGDIRTARALLSEAEALFAKLEMNMYVMATRYRLGTVIGGAEGQAMIDTADAWMRDQSIKRPDRWAENLAPGFVGI